MITLAVIRITGQIPEDAELTVLATNNGLDDNPVWQDVTQFVLQNYNFVFDNTTCTSGRWGFNFKVTAKRAEGGVGGYIESISGGFE